MIKKSVKKGCMRADGGAVKARADKAPRRAKGGKVHHGKAGKTNVNVIVAPHGGRQSRFGTNPLTVGLPRAITISTGLDALSHALESIWNVNANPVSSALAEAAARAGREAAARACRPAPLLIAVTVLTSMDEDTLRSTGVQRPLLEQVVTLARMTQDAGLDGVVASPQETAAIRAACGAGFTIVTPGIRGAAAGQDRNDQTRTMGPQEAVIAGASYLVVGRPIIAAPSPLEAARSIVSEMKRA